MKRNVFALLLLSLFLFSCAPQEEVVKIGVILPLSGSNAHLGESARHAVELAYAQKGDTRFTYELLFEDDRLDSKETVKAVNKLVHVDQVDAVLSFSSGSGTVVSPITEAEGVLHIGVALDKVVAEGDHNFIHWTPSESMASTLINELERRGNLRVAFFNLQQEGVLEQMHQIRALLPDSPVEEMYTGEFTSGTRDFRTLIAQARQQDPDIYMLMTFSPELELVYQQMRELGVQEPVTAIESFEYTPDPHLFDGYWYVQAPNSADFFVDAFVEQYGKQPLGGSGNAYDAFNLVVEGYEQFPSKPERIEVAQYLLQKGHFTGALGELFMQPSGIIFSEAVVKEVVDGEFVVA